uniref:Leucine-rich repeat-containing protein 15 n=1 Tax=Plectus sambesii TaxID=2011161 RepID=A0A914WJ45_9BILA
MIAKSLLFALILAVGAQAQCPPLDTGGPCRCAPSIYEPVAIVCENAGSLANALAAVSPARDIPIDSLTIIDTPVPRLQGNAFQGFSIIRLVLNRNGLNQIDDNAFEGGLIDSLLELDLTDNQLGQVPQTGMPKLRNLRKLYLNRNRIQSLGPNSFTNYASREMILKLELAGNRLDDGGLGDETVFRPLRNLEELSLETNELTTIPSRSLVNQRQILKNLNLGLNAINEVPVGALDFPRLESLSLEFNGIAFILPEAFQGIPNLQYLYITGNKFPSWLPEMFRYVGQLRTLGIGETPISVIPNNAFQYIPNLVRLEMSEAAVDAIERGAFQQTPQIQAIVLNKNRLSVVRSDMFQGLEQLYSIDLQSNRLETVEQLGFANLPALRHLDISNNQLQTMPDNTFAGTFQPVPNERRVIYACGNPWVCDRALEWFRQLLRDNLDIDINKPGCQATCAGGPADCFPATWPLRSPDPPCLEPPMQDAVIAGQALSLVGWIILAIIMTILLTSICLLAFVRYGISNKRKKEKEREAAEDEQRIVSSAASGYNVGGGQSMIGPSYPASAVDLDLPPAHTLDDRPNYFY